MTLKITIADAMLQYSASSHNPMAPHILMPYVILHTRDSQHKTRPSSGRNPSWGDVVLISQRQEDLTIQVFDSQSGIDDTIGYAFVKVQSLIGQPYIPKENVITLTNQHIPAGELRLITQFIEGKEHIGGLTSFQSKLMMAGQPMRTSQGLLQQGAMQSSGIQPGMMQQGMYSQGMVPQGIPQAMNSGMLTSQPLNMTTTQMSNLSNQQYAQFPQMPTGSNIQRFPTQGSMIYGQQMLDSRGQNMVPSSQQIIDPQMSILNMNQSMGPQPVMIGGGLSPMQFNASNQMRTSQTGLAAGNLTILGGTPSIINQTFGSRRMPIFKSGCPNSNWFSILDGQNKPSQCLPPRLI